MNHGARHGINQVDLGNVLRDLFPSHYVISNARNFGALVQPGNGLNLELDFWIPELKLAFEFQDPHHYVASLHAHEPLNAIQQKDEMKKEVLSSCGEVLIAVPCWWDGEEKSLAHTIRAVRPDLLLDWSSKNEEGSIEEGEQADAAEEGIPLVPPENYFEGGIPNVGALMQPVFANNAFDMVGWWIGEKYDGIRVCWHLEHKHPYLRSGKVLVLPSPFLRDRSCLPSLSVYLDGEIWFGRGSFHEPQTVLLNSQNNPISSPSPPPPEGYDNTSIAWHSLRFVVFDDASLNNENESEEGPFERRFRRLLEAIRPDHPFVTTMHKAVSTEYAHKILKKLIPEGGEGIVARIPNSLYVRGRTNSVMKFKAHKDQEALVVELEKDTPDGHIIYFLKLNTNVTIKAQYTPAPISATYTQNATPLLEAPQAGDVVTFCYNIVNAQGTPCNATILRVRKDLTWDSVLNTSSRGAELNGESESALIKRTRRVTGYWTNDDNKNTREFLDQFARSRNFDPLVPQNWLDTSTRDVIAAGGVGFISNYNGSLIKCLVDVYPEIGIRITTRNKLPQRYWKERENRKQVFDSLAKRMQFDPLIQKNWYWVTRQHIYAEKGGSSALDHYEGSIGNALKDIYPTVPWHEPNFFRRYWHEPLNRRKFFDSYARSMGFDPLVATNWYKVTTDSVVKHPGGYAVMEFHRSLHGALQELYPNLHLEDLKFQRMRFGYWNSATRRDFFDRFAQEHAFEPLIPENWYKFNATHITAAKGGFSALRSYGGSLIKAIIDLYPDINPDSSLFAAVPARHWRDPANRKALLVRVAKQRGLDPLLPTTWLKINAKAIKKVSGGRHLLKEAKGLQNALAEAFPDIKSASHKTRTKTSTSPPSIWDRIATKQEPQSQFSSSSEGGREGREGREAGGSERRGAYVAS